MFEGSVRGTRKRRYLTIKENYWPITSHSEEKEGKNRGKAEFLYEIDI